MIHKEDVVNIVNILTIYSTFSLCPGGKNYVSAADLIGCCGMHPKLNEGVIQTFHSWRPLLRHAFNNKFFTGQIIV